MSEGADGGSLTCEATAASEVNCADGFDNDCDGKTDEGENWANLSGTCFVGQGACQVAGFFICDEGDRTGPTVCSGTPGLDGTEIRNGLAADCDGATY